MDERSDEEEPGSQHRRHDMSRVDRALAFQRYLGGEPLKAKQRRQGRQRLIRRAKPDNFMWRATGHF